MKNIPTVIKVALGFILLSALTWLIIGVLIAAQLHPGMPSDPLIKWGMALASFAAFAVLVALAWLLAKRTTAGLLHRDGGAGGGDAAHDL